VSGAEDFDFLFGCWSVRHRRLRSRGCGCGVWDEFAGTAETRPLLGGLCNIEEHSIAGQEFSGIALRTFDREAQLWSIFWISEHNARLQPPVHGRFAGPLGEFEGRDADGGRLVQVKFIWDRSNPQAPRWQQSFSYDEGATWELNWLMEFER
jgi:hypothetical protein